MALATKVVAWLEKRGWTVYQEVAPHTYDRRADIVAVRGPLLYVVECKTSFGLAVLGQARHWLRSANLVSVATPGHRHADEAREVCAALALGWLSVGKATASVTEETGPAMRRRVSDRLRRCLRPEHQIYAKAGSQGGYFSAWRATTTALADMLRKYPYGLGVAEAVAKISHHYATDKSARCVLIHDVELGKVPGVVVQGSRSHRMFRIEQPPCPSQ